MAATEILMLSLLCAASAAGQGAYDAVDRHGKKRPIGLYGIGFRASGTGKSPAIESAFDPFHQYESERAEEFSAAEVRYTALHDNWEAEKKGYIAAYPT